MSHRSAASFRRIAGFISLASALAGPLGAQSSVKPLPRAAQPSSLAWNLLDQRATILNDVGDADGPLLGSGTVAPVVDDVAVVPRALPSQTHAPVVVDRGPTVELEVQGSGHPSSSLKDGGGEVNVGRAGWDARAGWHTGKNSALTVALHSEASFYQFADAAALIPGSGDNAPFNDVYETSLGATLCVDASERMAWFSTAAVTLAGEDNAAIGSSITLAAVSGVRFQARDDLAFDLGLAVATHHEQSPWVFPYLGFDWRIDDGVRFGTNGSSVHLAFDLNDKWTLSGEAAYKLREYRLNDDNPLPSGAFRDQEIDVGAALEWHPQPNTRLRVEGGIIAWRELEMFDSSGSQVSEIEVDPVPYAAFSLQFGF